jgi:hypothetical protein
MSIPDDEIDNGEVKVTFEEVESGTEEKDEVDPIEPLTVIGEQIANLSSNTITEEEDEEEVEMQNEDTSNVLKQLERQTVWMHKIEHEMDLLQNRLDSIDDRLQPLSIIRSDIESLPTRIYDILNRKRKPVKKTKSNNRASSSDPRTKKVGKILRKGRRK